MMREENHKLGISLSKGNSFLFGHDKQISFLLDRLRTRQIPNAWLFHGPMGIGKASLALNVGKVLSNIDLSKKNHVVVYFRTKYKKPKTTVNISNVYYCERRWDEKKLSKVYFDRRYKRAK